MTQPPRQVLHPSTVSLAMRLSPLLPDVIQSRHSQLVMCSPTESVCMLKCGPGYTCRGFVVNRCGTTHDRGLLM